MTAAPRSSNSSSPSQPTAGAATLLVRAAIAPMHAEARVSSPQTSQRLAGQLVRVLESQGDWHHVRGGDGYDGWMHAGYLVTPARRSLVAEAVAAEPRISLGARVRGGAAGERLLPLGARLADGEELVEGEAVTAAERAARFPASGAAIVASARRFFGGTSYQWGGVTPWGADCSGLVQSVFALHAVPLPRDAWQQAEAGRAAGDDPLALAAGDLLFFTEREDGRITHVGIAAGDGGRMLHLALGRGGWADDRLDDAADGYVAALRGRFRFARRIVG